MIEKNKRQSIVELLEYYSPSFQLQSGTDELRNSELFFSRTSNRTDNIQRASFAPSSEVLNCIADFVKNDHVTLETGGGRSTCVFATCAKKHICINPDITANELIRDFLREHNVEVGELVFLNETSDSALPRLDDSLKIDVAYIDGNHSFPIPIIDWHYIDLHLNVGAYILIDDVHMRSVGVLIEYLSTENSYEKVSRISTTVIYRKVAPNRTWGWADQGLNRKKIYLLRTYLLNTWMRLIRLIKCLMR